MACKTERGRPVVGHRATSDRSTLGRRRPAVPNRTCAVDECGNPARRRGWCGKHYARWRRHGDTSVVLPHSGRVRPLRKPRNPCSVDGCDREAEARGYCSLHWKRWRKYGSADVVIRGSRRAKRQITYSAAHARVTRERGRASEYVCTCGAPATDWGYDYTDPDEWVDENGFRYSGDTSRYVPMCRSCHRIADHERVKKALDLLRLWERGLIAPVNDDDCDYQFPTAVGE